MKETVKSRAAALAKSPHVRRAAVAAGLVGIALILLSELLPDRGGETEQTPLSETAAFSAKAYTEELEQRLGAVVGGIAGAGRCRVMVTLENGVEYVYASEEKAGSDYSADGERLSQTDDSESSVILIQTESGYEGLLVTEMQPTVKGVVVVCEGGGDETVRVRVSEAVSTVLNVTSKRVCVVEGQIDEQ